MPPEVQEQVKGQMAMVGPIDIGFMLLMAFISIFLLVSAILLVRRKPIAAKFHITYGIVATVVVIAHVAWGISRADDFTQMMKQNPAAASGPMAGFANMSTSLTIITGVIMGVFRLAYPVFCLIWFGIVKKNADMGTNEVSI